MEISEEFSMDVTTQEIKKEASEEVIDKSW